MSIEPSIHQPLLLKQADGSKKYGEFYLATTPTIHLPWLLLPSLLLLLVGIGYLISNYFAKKRRHNLYRQQALAELAQFQQDYLKQKTSPAIYLQQIQQLLKQTALTAYADKQLGCHKIIPNIAPLVGNAWLEFLIKQLRQTLQTQHESLLKQIKTTDFNLHYTCWDTNPDQTHPITAFHEFAALWIKHHQH